MNNYSTQSLQKTLKIARDQWIIRKRKLIIQVLTMGVNEKEKIMEHYYEKWGLGFESRSEIEDLCL